MANSDWCHFSHKPKFFFFSPVSIVLTVVMLFLSQHWGIFFWLTVAMWLYIVIFQYFFKMPIGYSMQLFRTWLIGKSKKPKNYRDNLEL